jgi:hypothetical protein
MAARERGVVERPVSAPKPPDGMVYEWTHVLGVPVNAGMLADYAAAGWTPVPQSRHRDHRVELFGARLMERPAAVHEASAARNLSQATGPQRQMFAQSAAWLASYNETSTQVLTHFGWVPMMLWCELELLAETDARLAELINQEPDDG